MSEQVPRKKQFDATTVLTETTGGCSGVDVAFSPMTFQFEDYNEPKLWELREKFRLDDVVAGKTTEWDQIIAISDWVADLIRATSGKPVGPSAPELDAFSFIEKGKKYRIHCTNASVIFPQAMMSMGYLARFTITHHTCDFWSNQWGKWVFMDAKGSIAPGSGPGGIYFSHKGVPLSMLEMRRLLYTGRWQEMEVRPSDAKIEGMGDYDTLFRRVGVVWRNNWFSQPYPPEYHSNESSRYIFRELLWWTDEHTPPRLGCWNTSQEHIFNFPVNYTQIGLDYIEELGSLNVNLHTFTPNFDCFQIKINQHARRRSPARFVWKLQPGENILEATAWNKFGREGIPSTVKVNYNPSQSKPEDFLHVVNPGS